MLSNVIFVLHFTGLMSRPPRDKPGKRGPTRLPNLVRLRSQGIKQRVEFDVYGEAIGDNSPVYRSFLGYLAKKVSIVNHDDWRLVEENVKDGLWNEVQVSLFVLLSIYRFK